MAKAVIQANIQSANGSVIVAPNASIYITDAGSGLPVTLWEERAGTTPTANPTTADTNGFFRVYANAGRVNIEATYGGNVQTFMDVPILEEGTGSPDGIITIDFASDADLTLSSTQAANRFIILTDTGVVLTTARNVIFPADAREWVVFNNTAQTLTAKTAAGTGIAITASSQMRVYGDETNIEKSLVGDADFRSISTLPPTTAGTATAYTVDLGISALETGRIYHVDFDQDGTATGATLNISSTGAKTILDKFGNAITPAAGIARLKYNGTSFLWIDTWVGQVLQTITFQDGAVNTGSTIIPLDNTVPQQSTDGDLYMSKAATFTHAKSNVMVDVVAHLDSSSASAVLMAALFQDSTEAAIAAGIEGRDPASGRPSCVTFSHPMVAGTTSSTTFKVHGGSSLAGTTTFNGTASAGLFGGVLASSIIITETRA